jgi:hypothetical protein
VKNEHAAAMFQISEFYLQMIIESDGVDSCAYADLAIKKRATGARFYVSGTPLNQIHHGQ